MKDYNIKNYKYSCVSNDKSLFESDDK